MLTDILFLWKILIVHIVLIILIVLIYERHMQSQVLYVVPITSILGRLALVPVDETGTDN